MEGKYALRTVQNADLTFADCRIPEWRPPRWCTTALVSSGP
jgi:hypothetical protein